MLQILQTSSRLRQLAPSLASLQKARFFCSNVDVAPAIASPEPASAYSAASQPSAEFADGENFEQPSTSHRHNNRHRHYYDGGDPDQPRIWRPRRYAVRLTRMTPSIARRDVARLFARFNITEDDVRPEFNSRTLETEAWWILFKTEEDRLRASVLQRSWLGTRRAFIRPVNNEHFMAQCLRCPLAMHSKGRSVLVENLEISTSLSGIIRFFEGYEMQGNAATIINAGKRMKEEPVSKYDDFEKFRASKHFQHNALATDGPEHSSKPSWPSSAPALLRAVVRFTTVEEAQRAVRNRNFSYLGNRQVRLRVLP